MPVFSIMALPMLCIAVALIVLARVKQNKNFLIPGFVLLSAGFVNMVLGFTAG